jgi:hypothetical protein
MFDQIVNRKNLEQAYFHVAKQLEEDLINHRYAGWDNLKLSDLEVLSNQVIGEAKTELTAFKELSPAILLKIPKKSDPRKMREIYIYSLKERIKAQAIYQIVEPYFEKFFSPWLFSYRSSHQSYFAARSVVRHYLKYFSRDYVLVADLSDYSNYIRQDFLQNKIKELNFEEPVFRLLSLFIGNKIIRAGEIFQPPVGLIQGVPLIALFNNLYLDAFDKFAGPRVDFYRRVGDDLIAFDQKKERLEFLKEHLTAEADRLGLKINWQKTRLVSASLPFSFLGYAFKNGMVALEERFCRSVLKRWQQQFSYYQTRSERRKQGFLKKVISEHRLSLGLQFRQIAEQKKLVTDLEQIKRLSEAFFHVLTRYFFGEYSEKNRRLLKEKLKKIHFTSFYKYFLTAKYDPRKRTN